MKIAFACCLALAPGFAKPATIEEIAKHGHVLTPGRYVGAEEVEDDAEPFAEKYPRLVAEVEECLAESERLAKVIREKRPSLRLGTLCSPVDAIPVKQR